MKYRLYFGIAPLILFIRINCCKRGKTVIQLKSVYYVRIKTERIKMFDIHCHICYGCDDGADSLDTAVKMAELALEKGTKAIAATPHCNIPGSFTNFWSGEFETKLDLLRAALAERGTEIGIFPGQEIFCTSRTPQLLESGELITLNNSRYPLVEFDFYEFSDSVYDKLRSLVSHGYVPVVAHPERYAFVSEESGAASAMKSIGCLLQINKGSLDGRFGMQAYIAASEMLGGRLADVIASDAHSPYMRTPDMSHIHEKICEEYSYEYADLLFSGNPERILENRETLAF